MMILANYSGKPKSNDVNGVERLHLSNLALRGPVKTKHRIWEGYNE